MIVAYRSRSRAVFLYGFAKSERENIESYELENLRDIAVDLLAADSAKIEEAIQNGALQEVYLEEEKST